MLSPLRYARRSALSVARHSDGVTTPEVHVAHAGRERMRIAKSVVVDAGGADRSTELWHPGDLAADRPVVRARLLPLPVPPQVARRVRQPLPSLRAVLPGACNRPVRSIAAECCECLDCQVEYCDEKRCPPLVQAAKRRDGGKPGAAVPAAAAFRPAKCSRDVAGPVQARLGRPARGGVALPHDPARSFAMPARCKFTSGAACRCTETRLRISVCGFKPVGGHSPLVRNARR